LVNINLQCLNFVAYVNIIRRIRRMCQRNEHFPYVSSPAKGNLVLEFPDRRQVWLPRMCQRDACWAGELSLMSSHLVNAER